MYKVFYNDRTVFFIENDHKSIASKNHKIHYYNDKKALKNAIESFIDDEDIQYLYIINKDIELAFNTFESLYETIEAAGGLVKDKDQNILAIFRRGKWDLPKGKLEKNELPEIAAVREVEEECGIDQLEVQKLVEITYHTYQLKGKDILKKTYWYEMLYNGNQTPKPQTEEDITEVKWVKSNLISEITHNTYQSILEVLNKGKVI